MNVLKKLQDARVKLQAEKLEKTGRNEYAGYDYFQLEDFLPQTQVIFGEIGLCGVVNYSVTDNCSLTIYNTDDRSDNLVIYSPWAEAMLKGCHPVQNLGAAETYQRRYLWVTAMEIVEHDALDSVTGKEEGKPEMVMTNRLVPKHYWDAEDEIVKAKIIGVGNSIRKNDKDNKWYICEPKQKEIANNTQPTEPTPSPPSAEKWRGRIRKITKKSSSSGVDYWEIVSEPGTCFCKNAKLVEELRAMDQEELDLTVKEMPRRPGVFELTDFGGALS